MSTDFWGDFSALLSVERTKLNDIVKRDIGRAVTQANARGLLRSSVSMKLVTDTAINAIPVYAQTALNLVLRAASAHGETISADNQTDIMEGIKKELLFEIEMLRAAVTGSVPFRDSGISGGDRLMEQIDKAADLELQRVSGELNLIVAQNKRAEGNAQTGSTIIVNAPVGVLQTGPGSFGVANQHIDAGAAEALDKALTALLEQLERTDGDGRVNVHEIAEMVTESKAELQKPKPNASKLKSLITGIGSTISYLPKLKDAYDTLKWAANGIGVPLP